MKKHILISLSILLGIFTVPVLVFAYQSPGKPNGFVNDFAGMLSLEEKTQLERKLVPFAVSTSNEMAVVTIKSLDGDTIENFANKLFTEWKVGNGKNDNGVLLLIALEDRQMRIEVGYGLEGALPDATAHEIIQNDLTPRFKEGKYYEGIDAAVEKIMSATRGEYTASATSNTGNSITNFLFKNGFTTFIFIIFFFQWFGAMLARTKSWWLGGVIGGVVSMIMLLFTSLPYVGNGLIFLALIGGGLLFDYVVSKGYNGAHAQGIAPPWWTGGGSIGGGGTGGGSFGGFGGGSSGGGGASGRW